MPDNDKSSSGEDVEYGATKGENERHRKKVFLCINMPIILYMDSWELTVIGTYMVQALIKKTPYNMLPYLTKKKQIFPYF